jgi:hypothetical protein
MALPGWMIPTPRIAHLSLISTISAAMPTRPKPDRGREAADAAAHDQDVPDLRHRNSTLRGNPRVGVTPSAAQSATKLHPARPHPADPIRSHGSVNDISLLREYFSFGRE